MPSIHIIGSGNVAWTFGKRLLTRSCQIKQIHARNRREGEKLAARLKATYIEDLTQLEPEIDIILLAVTDDAIAEVASHLPDTSATVIHCSGSTPLNVIDSPNRAVIWPLRSISKNQRTSWKNLNMILESDTDLGYIQGLNLIECFGARAVKMDGQSRKTAHLVAVMLNNFSNHLLHMADVLCDEQGLDRRIFQDLIVNTLELEGKAKDSQTGPAVRQDRKTLNNQLKRLADKPHFQKIYEAITASIIKEHHGEKL